jgi:hypothetical protein
LDDVEISKKEGHAEVSAEGYYGISPHLLAPFALPAAPHSTQCSRWDIPRSSFDSSSVFGDAKVLEEAAELPLLCTLILLLHPILDALELSGQATLPCAA